jgi:hypothetical protein
LESYIISDEMRRDTIKRLKAWGVLRSGRRTISGSKTFELKLSGN